MLRPYQAVLFDFDGTLAPNLDLKSMKSDLLAFSVQETAIAPSEIEGLYILELIDYTTAWLASNNQNSKDYFEAAHKRVKDIEVKAAQSTQLFQNSKPLLKRIRALGLKIGIVTRNCEEAIRTVLPEVDDYCDALFTREQVEHLKPDPRHLQACLAALNCSATKSMMVGDSKMDMQAGIALKMHCIAVLTGSDSKEILERSGAHQVIPSIAAFPIADLLKPQKLTIPIMNDQS